MEKTLKIQNPRRCLFLALACLPVRLQIIQYQEPHENLTRKGHTSALPNEGKSI